MMSTIRRTAMAVAALAAFALGGAAIAGAADNESSSSSTTSSAQPRDGRGDRRPLSADVAAKVKAAALAKVPGATVVRTEAGGPYDSAYHAHVKTSGGTLEVVLVNASFAATAVRTDRGRRGDGPGDRGGHRGGRANETALTGDTKSKVEAAVLAKYPGATIVRSETNADSRAPYEAHITTSAGTEIEVTVSSDFAVVAATRRPALR